MLSLVSLWSSTVMSFYHTTGSLPYVVLSTTVPFQARPCGIYLSLRPNKVSLRVFVLVREWEGDFMLGSLPSPLLLFTSCSLVRPSPKR